jgi:hypothetical protein
MLLPACAYLPTTDLLQTVNRTDEFLQWQQRYLRS